jgi:hypothetical protein
MSYNIDTLYIVCAEKNKVETTTYSNSFSFMELKFTFSFEDDNYLDYLL